MYVNDLDISLLSARVSDSTERCGHIVPQVEVHWRLKGEPDTLYLCINILDRFLDRKQVPKNKLQLVGVTAYLVSAPTAPIEPSMRAVHHL